MRIRDWSSDVCSSDLTLGSALDRDHADTTLAVRDRAIIELFYSAGLRLAELQQLDIDAFDGQQASFTVRGKGGKERIAMLGGKARAALDRWLQQRVTYEAADRKSTRLNSSH